MISASFDGWVTSQPTVKEGNYGKFIDITLRVSTAGREVHFVTSRFFGRKIGPIVEYINNGDYITMSGCVTSIKEKTYKEKGGKYSQIYIKDACYSLPPKIGGEGRFRPDLPSVPLAEGLDNEPSAGDNEDPF